MMDIGKPYLGICYELVLLLLVEECPWGQGLWLTVGESPICQKYWLLKLWVSWYEEGGGEKSWLATGGGAVGRGLDGTCLWYGEPLPQSKEVSGTGLWSFFLSLFLSHSSFLPTHSSLLLYSSLFSSLPSTLSFPAVPASSMFCSQLSVILIDFGSTDIFLFVDFF